MFYALCLQHPMYALCILLVYNSGQHHKPVARCQPTYQPSYQAGDKGAHQRQCCHLLQQYELTYSVTLLYYTGSPLTVMSWLFVHSCLLLQAYL